MDTKKFNDGITMMIRNVVANSGGTISNIELDGVATELTNFAVSCLNPDLSMEPFNMDLKQEPPLDNKV